MPGKATEQFIEQKRVAMERERKRRKPNQSLIDQWEAEIAELQQIQERLIGGNSK